MITKKLDYVNTIFLLRINKSKAILLPLLVFLKTLNDLCCMLCAVLSQSKTLPTGRQALSDWVMLFLKSQQGQKKYFADMCLPPILPHVVI